jgi:MFS family permease
MNSVPEHERPAAASLTNVPRSLATALSPSLAGWLLAASSFGWPLVLAGSLKISYDLLLYRMFRGNDGAPGAPLKAPDVR